jgi:Flp pilus assembly CpaE family ATPase
MNSNFSAHLDAPNVEPLGTDGLSIAVIGPDNLLRSAAARALAGCHKGEVREFSSYPPCLGDLPQLLDQHHDIVMIELDSNPDYALDLVEGICASGMSTVMVYSKDADPDVTDPDLLMRCMRAGAREFLSMPFGDKSMSEALVRAAARRPTTRADKETGGRLLVFCGAKGGAGVTAIACNFAIALSMESSESTLLIDLDLPMGDAALNLGIVADYSTVDALQNANRLDSSFLSKLIVKHSSGISVLASPGNVSAYQPSNEAIDKLLTIARQDFKNVVVDVGSRLDSTTSMAPLSDATMFYLVTQTGIPELRNANRLISQYFSSESAKLEIVLNRYESRGTKISDENVRKALTRAAKWRIPNDYASIRRMQDNAAPVALTDSYISRQIGQMARFVCGLPEIPEKKRGFSLKGLGLGLSTKGSPAEESADVLQLQLVTGQSKPSSARLLEDEFEQPSLVTASSEKSAEIVPYKEIEKEAEPGPLYGDTGEKIAFELEDIDDSTYEEVNEELPKVEWYTPTAITCGTGLSDTQLRATASVPGTFTYTPPEGFKLPAGTHTIWATFTPARRGRHAKSVQAFVSVTVHKATPVIWWNTPTAIFCGTPLSINQLDATADVPGSFTYTPSEGYMPAAGVQTLSVFFTPADTETYSAADAQVQLTVAKSVPTIKWPIPLHIPFGTALSAVQLNAAASIPGTFVYSPGEGDILTAGRHILSVMFTPADSASHTVAEAEVSIMVSRAKPVVTWRAPHAMSFGTPLGAVELNATASVAGSFEYTPGMGAVLSAGRHNPVALFTPADANNYLSVQVAAPIDVVRAIPTITWPIPDELPYGSPLGEVELNATASVPGTFTFVPEAGTLLPEGTQELTATFIPADDTNYTAAQASVSLMVTKAAPIAVSWPAPEAITYGDRLGARQLNATASVAGTFTYNPPAGEVLGAGNHTLSVTFTPADAHMRSSVASVDLVVHKAIPNIVWPSPASISYGVPLSATELNASASVPGTFEYAPALGEILGAGVKRLSVRFAPLDSSNLMTTEASTSLTIKKAAPTITWPAPAPISYGTALGSRQLNASASVPGTFTYAPFTGTVLTAGSHTISVSFAPSDNKNLATVQASVPIAVLLTNIALMPLDSFESDADISFESEEDEAFEMQQSKDIDTEERLRAFQRNLDTDNSFLGRALPEGIHVAAHATRDAGQTTQPFREAWQIDDSPYFEVQGKTRNRSGLYLQEDGE